MNMKTALMVLRLVDLVASGARLTGELRGRYVRTSGKIKDLIREGREPTDEEWDELVEDSRAQTDRIRAAHGGEKDPE